MLLCFYWKYLCWVLILELLALFYELIEWKVRKLCTVMMFASFLGCIECMRCWLLLSIFAVSHGLNRRWRMQFMPRAMCMRSFNAAFAQCLGFLFEPGYQPVRSVITCSNFHDKQHDSQTALVKYNQLNMRNSCHNITDDVHNGPIVLKIWHCLTYSAIALNFYINFCITIARQLPNKVGELNHIINITSSNSDAV